MLILGIETSCDETGTAVYDSQLGLLAHAVYTQTEIHQQYGGVVPELASRDHVRKIIPLIKNVLSQTNFSLKDLNGIAYTIGPGLVGALLVGACVGRSLSYALTIPAVGVHHMEGHLFAAMLEKNPPEFPFIALLVSGGHTQLVRVTSFGNYELLGESIDDAVGEAFDKTAKLLGLNYPGGAELAALAEHGNPKRFLFPRPMLDRPGLDFSFSGLKTCAVNTFKKNNNDAETRADIARAFQDAIVETLVTKCKRALHATGLKRLVVAGGVGANNALRSALRDMLSENVFFPRQEFCTDNGAMIAYVGCQYLLAGKSSDLAIKVFSRGNL